jgi:hypothetical protein
MTTTAYMSGRKKFQRPQAMLWSDTPGTISGGTYIPTGYELYSDQSGLTTVQKSDSFIIISDHNRAEIHVTPQRIEQRKRMINGTMRSNYIADKIQISTSWSLIPSRSFAQRSNFSQSTGKSLYTGTEYEYTADGGAGGTEMLDWYETHHGPFWVFLSYDKYTNFGKDNAAHQHLAQYSQVVQMYISNLDYSIVKRGGSNHDLWNISVTLEEV